MTFDVRDALAAAIGKSPCAIRCWPCTMLAHPGGHHTWPEDDDIRHGAVADGVCGCWCVKEPAGFADPDEFADYPPLDEWDPFTETPCPVCGEYGACGNDAEGRPLIHVMTREDGE